jgi:DNA-binding response OmpR family regulator
MADRALIVDDEEAIRKLLTKVVVSNGIEAETAKNGEDAFAKLSGNPDAYQVILLDVMMGGLDGFSLLKRIRAMNILTPVIIISSKTEDYDALYGLGLGADDYITKPFNPIVLGAKIQALLRRTRIASKEPSSLLTAGPFTMNTKTMHFYKDGQEVFLSSKEFILMQLFMEQPEQVFSKEALYKAVWEDMVVDDNTIMVYINRLRSKIEDNPKAPRSIVTVRGLGYTLSI